MEMLGLPSWPLCRLVLLLYITGGFSSLHELLEELKGPMEVDDYTYHDPQKTISPHIEPLQQAVDILTGNTNQISATAFEKNGDPCDALESAFLLAQQQVIEKELEKINSILCAPCSCTLCCTGPKSDDLQEYFEIPLSEHELVQFDLNRIEDNRTITTTAPEAEKKWPFYKDSPALFHWSSGWSLILPKESSCPNLSKEGRCKIYENRPYVCKKPQIFSYVLEKQNDKLIKQEKLLAITDCPYVKNLKEEIAKYGRLCGLEVVFSRNKI